MKKHKFKIGDICNFKSTIQDIGDCIVEIVGFLDIPGLKYTYNVKTRNVAEPDWPAREEELTLVEGENK